MLGKTGNIIIELEDCYSINPAIDFITEGEKQLINKIVNLGYYYQKIRVYTEEDEKMFKNLGKAPPTKPNPKILTNSHKI